MKDIDRAKKDKLYALVCLFVPNDKGPSMSRNAIYNCLRRGGINTPVDLTNISLEDLFKIRDVGYTKFVPISGMKTFVDILETGWKEALEEYKKVGDYSVPFVLLEEYINQTIGNL